QFVIHDNNKKKSLLPTLFDTDSIKNLRNLVYHKDAKNVPD
ncbi:3509_t:CDS:1, partial [Entrophospora sp. SA101]